MYCPKCGNAQPDGIAACASCGQPVAVASAPTVIPAADAGAEGLALPLLLLPLAGLFLFVLATSKVSGQFLLLEAPGRLDSANTFLYAGWGVVLVGSAILAYLDAQRAGFGKRAEARGAYRWGPGQWLAGMLLLWGIAFPWYFAARRQVPGSTRRLLPALGITVLVVGGALVASSAISQVEGQVARAASEMRQQFQQADRELREAMKALGQ